MRAGDLRVERRKGRGPGITVVAASVIEHGRLLVVSKKAAPEMFYLPGGKPDPGESAEATLRREMREELGVWLADVALLDHFDSVAALEQVPMRLTVFTAVLGHAPQPYAELACIGWTSGRDDYALAPAVRGQVIPYLRRTGKMPC